MTTHLNISPAPTLAEIRSVVHDDLQAIDQMIHQSLRSTIPLINTISEYIVNHQGKRMRPLMLLLATRALGYLGTDNEHHELATIVEFIHTATLLHDDVIDNSAQRRGQDTAHHVWGMQASILIGDFLYSRSFQILAKRNRTSVMRVLADATNKISEGEVQQLTHIGNTDLSFDTYLSMIEKKTAVLFEAAAHIGGLIGAPNAAHHCETMRLIGLNFGICYQIIDDCLDYSGNEASMGKNLGDDLAEGKMTLPLIYALEDAPTATSQLIISKINKKQTVDLASIQQLIADTQAMERCRQTAARYACTVRHKLALLPASAYQKALGQLLDFVLNQ